MSKDFASRILGMKEPERGNNGPGQTVIDRPTPVLGNKEDEKVDFPKQFHVILLNDDVTPYMVVVEVIMEIFSFGFDEAHKRMRKAHQTGRAIMGTFTKDVADTKAVQVTELCRQKHGPYPLRAEVEEAPTPGA
jgi:ATP-dependent Clp protease adaptor protein ClpS